MCISKLVLDGIHWQWSWDTRHLQFTSSSEVSQKLDNMGGSRWGNGQMGTGGLESVLISHPVDGVSVVIIADVGVASAGNGTDVLDRGSDFLLVSAFADGNSVVGLETNGW